VTWAAAHPGNDLSVGALARRIGRSPRHLTRVFRRELGITPGEAVEKLRLEAARRVLQQSKAGLKEVAERCGFNSAEVLRRTFLRTLHVTPSAYRARFSAGEKLVQCESKFIQPSWLPGRSLSSCCVRRQSEQLRRF